MFTRATIRCLAAAALLWLGICSAGWLGVPPAYAAGETAENRVNLWPLLYYRYPVLSVLWPVSRFDFETNDYRVFPVYWGEDYFVAFPEIWWFEEDKGVLPVFWGEDYFVVAPVVWWFDETKGVLPVFWRKDGFAVLPVFWYQKDEFCHMFPAWMYWEDGDNHDTWALWPVFRWKRWNDERAFHIWPLAGTYEDGDERYRFALWPLCQDWRDGENSLTLTPVWSAGTRGEARWDMVFPAYYRSMNPSKGTTCFLTPLVGRTQSGEKSRWYLVPLASSAAWGEDEKDVWMLGPTAHFRWGGDDVQSHVLPFYYYNRNDDLFLSPIYSRHDEEDEGFVNVLTLLAHYSYSSDGGKTFMFLPPLTSVSWGGKGGPVDGLLFSYGTSLSSDERYSDRKAYDVEIASWLRFERGFGGREIREADGSEWSGEWHVNECVPLWHYKSHKDPDRDRCYRDFSLLGLLYDYRLRKGRPVKDSPGNQENYVRRRVLWRGVHYERTDENKALDVFPGITWDSRANGYRQFSFLWRLFRTERTEDGGRNLDILFLPLMRREGTATSGSRHEDS